MTIDDIPPPTERDLAMNWIDQYESDERIAGMMPDFQADAHFENALIRLLAAALRANRQTARGSN